MRTAEQIREAKRQYMANRRAKDPESVRAYLRAQHFKNHERSKKKMRDYYARRFFWGKSMKLRGEDRASFKDLAALWKSQRGRCALTGRKLDRSAHLDHIVAKVRGGGDNIGNLRWLCREANMAKRDMSDGEFLSLCGDVMRWIGDRIHGVQGRS